MNQYYQTDALRLVTLFVRQNTMSYPQTYVMPGTLERLWCIFEMAYSLLFNSRLVYYHNYSHLSSQAEAEATSINNAARSLLARDANQMAKPCLELLSDAECFR